MARILVVDDDPDVQEAARLYLEKEGYEVETVSSRQEGQKRITDSPPDLVLLDIMMESPDDGIALAQDLRKAGFLKPILMLSSIDIVTGGYKYGKDGEINPVDDFLEKPARPDVLVERVKALLSRKK